MPLRGSCQVEKGRCFQEKLALIHQNLKVLGKQLINLMQTTALDPGSKIVVRAYHLSSLPGQHFSNKLVGKIRGSVNRNGLQLLSGESLPQFST